MSSLFPATSFSTQVIPPDIGKWPKNEGTKWLLWLLIGRTLFSATHRQWPTIRDGDATLPLLWPSCCCCHHRYGFLDNVRRENSGGELRRQTEPFTDDVDADVATRRVALAVARHATVDAGVVGAARRADGQHTLVVQRVLVAVAQHLVACDDDGGEFHLQRSTNRHRVPFIHSMSTRG